MSPPRLRVDKKPKDLMGGGEDGRGWRGGGKALNARPRKALLSLQVSGRSGWTSQPSGVQSLRRHS